MKTNVSVNIDTVEFSVSGERNTFNILKTTTSTIFNEDGEIIDSYQNRKAIDGKFGIHKLNARTLHSGAKLAIEGSPYAFKYGQNIYTSSEMKTGVINALKNVCTELGIETTKIQKQKWKAGEIDLNRVDLAVHFKLSSEEECLDVLRQVRRQLEEQGGSTKSNGSTVCWTPKDGKEYSISFYAKGPQMRMQTSLNKLPWKDKLLNECESILRVEVRLRALALRKLGLDKVSAWTADSAEVAFRTYFSRLRLLEVTSGPLTAEELKDLPNNLRHVYALHKAGYNLKLIYPEGTLRKHLASFRKLKIDLKCPNQEAPIVLSLYKFLSPKRTIQCAPAWMMEEGLVSPINNEMQHLIAVESP
jgi:hypothetical protein